LELVDTLTQVERQDGRASIIGDSGLIIPGYSDAATLQNQQFNTTEEIEQERQRLTSNRVVVTLDSTDSIQDHKYSVSYVTNGNQGSRSSITGSPVSHFELGDLSITYST
jgi:hypothetical protein